MKEEAAAVELVFYPSTRRLATTGKTGEKQDQEAGGSEGEINITAQRQAVRKSGICPTFLHTCEKFV